MEIRGQKSEVSGQPGLEARTLESWEVNKVCNIGRQGVPKANDARQK
jgi:hypothetical protein